MVRINQQYVAFAAIISIFSCGLPLATALCPFPVQLQKHPAVSTNPKLLKLSNRIATFKKLADNSNSLEQNKTSRPKALGTLQIPTLVGGLAAAVITQRVLATSSSRLFRQHVTGAVMGSMVFLPAAIGSVQSRVDATKSMKNESAATRRGVLLRHIQAHFYLTYAAALSAVVSVGSIFYNKIVLGKPHFTSLHSRVGLMAAALWAGAYFVAQAKVWTPLIRGKKKGPNLLWASQRHRQLGKAASILTLVTTSTGVGLSAWGRTAFGPLLPLIVGIVLSVPIALVFPRK
mmetsp:Transcript_18686/g.27653  ORF Transcript_18686/g.27653 Transcript_18686/m.27653 type:complete len:289 (+) Transcript_18686:146-1012(+)|eukprot:CAMPEP_0194203530 /NCGR_PEP_ID=MMETSP0156-20130528/3276_1 /TAXON_ID=33649 /ORGANISM="Thalassionema nitzschioides, Strain L26-B" /LENGTH=288 /DNA_ID=CAMNT_0038929295 /DNA_START=60 /DNA_END=926 /DNA_ORIENTATION=-